MKSSKLSFLILSLPAVAVMFPYSANAALRINNSSLIQEQAMINARAVAEYQASQQVAPQAARYTTNEDGEKVPVSNAMLESCHAIYPNGQFDWVKPTSGRLASGPETCSALVEMRSYQGTGGTTYTVLARTYVGAGDGIKCNIDEFSDITVQGRGFTYPSDNPPTVEDVEKVMAQEQKANAGWKILGAALVGGIGGNLLGKGDAGSDSPLGLNGDKLKSTAIGAAGAAAVMTASTQSNNYKAGTMILSTGVNTAAGAVAGNLLASGDDVLNIQKCSTYTGLPATVANNYCLAGTRDDNNGSKTTIPQNNDEIVLYEIDTGKVYKYKYKVQGNVETVDTPIMVDVVDVTFWDGYIATNIKSCQTSGVLDLQCKKDLKDRNKTSSVEKYNIDKDSNNQLVQDNSNGKYLKIKSAAEAGKRKPAIVVLDYPGFKDKAFGYDYSEWTSKIKPELKKLTTNVKIYDYQGNPVTSPNVDEFYPATQSADDGNMVDFTNKARTKSTLIGAAGGAGLGALAGAAGADAAIQERYVAALREYEDSLGSIVCATGDRYLAKYNDIAFIPEMTEKE